MKLPPAVMLVVSLLLLSLGIASGYLISSGFLGGQGQFNYAYTSGSAQITSITYSLPHDLASSITIDSAGSFTPVLQGDTLRLTGGSLFPGQSMVIYYHQTRYLDPGDRNYTSLALTGNGQSISAKGVATVQADVILQVFTEIADNSLPAEVIGAVGAVGAGAWVARDAIKGRDQGPLFDEAPGPGTPPPTTGERPTTQEKKDDVPHTVPAGSDIPHTTTTEKRTPKPTVYGIDLTKCPKAWLPEGIKTVTFTATIWKCVEGTGWVPSDKPFVIEFILSGVSREKGICLNKGEGVGMDLWFPKKENGGDAIFKFFDPEPDTGCEDKILGAQNRPHTHYPKVATVKPVLKQSVVVRSEDFGAWGWIEAIAEGCVQIPPREDVQAPVNCGPGQCCTGANKVKIPRDEDDNNIADAAPQNSTGGGEDGAKKDVDDTPTGDGTKGDGLTAYEEYRGFMVNEGAGDKEKHIRTDIKKKDVFVYIDDKKLDRLGYFQRTGLEVHKIFDPKLVNGEEKREINFNRHYATGGVQHALWLHKNNGLKNVYGRACGLTLAKGWEDETQPEIVVPGPPGVRSHVCISLEKCTKGKDYMGLAQPPDRLDQVIAHELGHGVNLPHHGEGGRHGHPRSGQQEPDYFYMKGALSSGAVDCVMEYDRHAEGWCSGDADDLRAHVRHETYWDRKKKKWLETPGTHYCDSRTGDGVNKAGTDTNDATNGNCQSLIKVKDW